MKICACIAEYNPLHLGHLKHIEYIKNTLKAEKIIVVMSGNFTQRGEPAVLDKFTRAKEAIFAGADAVIELPTPFAVGNAETFAFGAISIINSLGVVDGICFGVESGDKEDYLSLAKEMNKESKEFKRALKEELDKGVSLAKAKFNAVKSLTGGKYDENLVSLPNNILGLEYTKAILKLNSDIEIFPMIRSGNHNDENLKKGVTSASSIRNALKSGNLKKTKKCMPKYVYKDLKGYPYAFDKMIMTKIITDSAEKLKKCPDCTEGLENRIKALAKDNRSVEGLTKKTATKRYTEARIRRILISNLLGITQDIVERAKEEKLYIKFLAIKSSSKDLMAEIAKKSSLSVLTRKSDINKLNGVAEICYNIDVLASDLYNLATGNNKNENYTAIIEK